MKNGQKKKDAFFHITKRANPSLKRGIIVRAVAILAAFLLSALVTVLLTGDNPFSVLSTLFSGAFGKGRMLNTIHELAILLCISLAVTPAFRMRFWNTGAEGQTLMGGLATAVVMLLLHDKVPTFVLILLIKMRKSPFDVSTSHHAHQELVMGVKTEMGAQNLAIFTITEWYETSILMGIVGLFVVTSNPLSYVGAILLCAAVYFFLIIADNACARVKWTQMLQITWLFTLFASGVNLLILMLIK